MDMAGATPSTIAVHATKHTLLSRILHLPTVNMLADCITLQLLKEHLDDAHIAASAPIVHYLHHDKYRIVMKLGTLWLILKVQRQGNNGSLFEATSITMPKPTSAKKLGFYELLIRIKILKIAASLQQHYEQKCPCPVRPRITP